MDSSGHRGRRAFARGTGGRPAPSSRTGVCHVVRLVAVVVRHPVRAGGL